MKGKQDRITRNLKECGITEESSIQKPNQACGQYQLVMIWAQSYKVGIWENNSYWMTNQKELGVPDLKKNGG